MDPITMGSALFNTSLLALASNELKQDEVEERLEDEMKKKISEMTDEQKDLVKAEFNVLEDEAERSKRLLREIHYDSVKEFMLHLLDMSIKRRREISMETMRQMVNVTEDANDRSNMITYIKRIQRYRSQGRGRPAAPPPPPPPPRGRGRGRPDRGRGGFSARGRSRSSPR